MKVLHVHNMMLRNYGMMKFRSGRKLSNGIVRNNYELLEFSDRDLVRFEAPLHIRPLGKKIVNRKLIEACDNFQPNLILIGHCDLINEKTLQEIRQLHPDVKIAHWFLDALWSERNIERLKTRMHCTDAIFITTGGEPLKQFCTGKNKVAYLPNPTDPSMDNQNNALKTDFERDLLFCGVGLQSDYRYQMLIDLHKNLNSTLRFDSFGIYGEQPIWGQAYDDLIARSKMGLNLNRIEGWPLYSSDRIAQLFGNGLLTFLWDKGGMRKLFNDDQAVFFNDTEDLTQKIKTFQQDDSLRKQIAQQGFNHYHEHFSAERIIRFITETTFGTPYSHDYLWQNEVYS